jgi:hypothetical protein
MLAASACGLDEGRSGEEPTKGLLAAGASAHPGSSLVIVTTDSNLQTTLAALSLSRLAP